MTDSMDDNFNLDELLHPADAFGQGQARPTHRNMIGARSKTANAAVSPKTKQNF